MPLLPRRPSWLLPEPSATPERIFADRRALVRALGLGAIAAAAPARLAGAEPPPPSPSSESGDPALEPALGSRFAERFPAPGDEEWTTDETVTPAAIAGRTNNFYEFTPAKNRVWELARDYPVDPWTVEIRGEVEKPRTLDLDDLFAFELEERIYRLRCVERWAIRIPWTGFPLRRLLETARPLSSARWVRFVSFLDLEGLPGQKRQTWYPWPYYEALRIDEATHDLAFAVVGAYGRALPMQHGAPWRVAVPWKYGFKSPKSIVRIELLRERPGTFWNDLQPAEYGFFSNVDPTKPHPRWSQEWEKDLGTGETRPTVAFNGYGEQVAGLYAGDETRAGAEPT